MNLNIQNFTAFLSTVALASISPLIVNVGIPAGALFLLTLLLTIALHRGRTLSRSFLFLTIIILFISFIPAIYNISIEIVLIPVYFLFSFLAISLLTKGEFEAIRNYYTVFIFALLLGALISLLYKIIGGDALFYIENPDGRLNYFVPFTFTNSVWGNFLRPAGIYDEPGAFSFFICSVVTIRSLLRSNPNVSFWILLIGMVTFSLAHIVFLITFVLSFKGHTARWCIYLLMIALIFLLTLSAVGAYEIFYNIFLIRFELVEGGGLHGDNRTKLFLNTLQILTTDLSHIITGLNDELRNNSESFLKRYGKGMDTGANPLNMLLKLGLMSLIYYLSLIFLIIMGVSRGRSGFFLLGFAALLLQRDYIFVISYCYVASMVIILSYRERKNF